MQPSGVGLQVAILLPNSSGDRNAAKVSSNTLGISPLFLVRLPPDRLVSVVTLRPPIVQELNGTNVREMYLVWSSLMNEFADCKLTACIPCPVALIRTLFGCQWYLPTDVISKFRMKPQLYGLS
jgi:hypothetical protein